MHGRSRVVFAAFALALATTTAIASCALPDAAEYAAPPVVTVDARAPVPPTDLTSDAAGSAPPSAPLDAGVDADAGSAGCRDHAAALFCADFEQGPVDYGFGLLAGSGPLALGSTFFVSPGHALTTMLASRGNSKPFAAEQHPLPAGISSVRLRWSVRVDSSGAQDAVDLGGLTRGAPFHSLVLRYTESADVGSRLTLFEYGDPIGPRPQITNFVPFGKGMPVGRFVRFDLRLTRGSGASSATVAIDDEVVLTNVPLSEHLYPAPSVVVVGIANSDGAGAAITVTTDDVLAEAL